MAKIVETSDEWITTRTGISHRHHLAEGETITDMTVLAARRALENAGVTADQIGACVVATLTADTQVPSAACRVQRELGLPHDTVCFDLNAACTGFLYALHTMECLLNASERKFGVIGAENLSRITNWADRGTCILFGDGAGAVVVECDPSYESIHAFFGLPRHRRDAAVPGVEKGVPSLVYMEGTKVSVRRGSGALLHRPGPRPRRQDRGRRGLFVFHQANARSSTWRCGNTASPRRSTIKTSTNTATPPPPASPWSSANSTSRARSVRLRVLVVGFGGGLTWAAPWWSLH